MAELDLDAIERRTLTTNCYHIGGRCNNSRCPRHGGEADERLALIAEVRRLATDRDVLATTLDDARRLYRGDLAVVRAERDALAVRLHEADAEIAHLRHALRSLPERDAAIEIEKARAAMLHGADDSRWRPGETAVEALIRERDEARGEAADVTALYFRLLATLP